MTPHLNDTMIIAASAALNTDDHHVLSLLYQPLIGSAATTLYLTLSALVERHQLEVSNLKHKDIFDILDLKLSEWNKAREKLEAINLLNTYKKEDTMLYMLKQPLTARQFFNDGILGIYLFSEIGEDNYRCLRELFVIPKIDKEGYEHITKNFDDVFKSTFSEETIDFEGYLLDKKQNNSVQIKNGSFHFEYFLEGIPRSFMPKKNDLYRLENHLKKIAFIYGLNEAELQTIYTKAVDRDSIIDLVKISREANVFYREKHRNLTPKIANRDSSSEAIDPRVAALKKPNPARILEKYGDGKAKAIDLKNVESLMQGHDVDPAVINALLIYVLKIKEGILPNLNYLQKVLASWQEKGIHTAEDAAHYLTQTAPTTHTPQKQTRPRHLKSEKAVPDWFDEYYKAFKAREE